MKNIITISQDLHFQLFGEYIEDFQDSRAQIITTHLQQFGNVIKTNIHDVDVKIQLECEPDKIFMSQLDKDFYSMMKYL